MSETKLTEIIRSKGISYNEYMSRVQDYVENTDDSTLNEHEKENLNYTKLNLQRSRRIEKTYIPSAELKEAAGKIKTKQTWFVITEAWCGDSAQNLPYLAKMASQNNLIDFYIIYRDENPEIMDMYLTNGTKSIPILVAVDDEQNEIFKWGPRPKEAVELVKKAKEEGLEKHEFIEKLHLWYGRNRGAALEGEIKELLHSSL